MIFLCFVGVAFVAALVVAFNGNLTTIDIIVTAFCGAALAMTPCVYAESQIKRIDELEEENTKIKEKLRIIEDKFTEEEESNGRR